MKNVCIVGYGSIAPVHALCLSRIPEAQLCAVCDPDPEALARCQAQYEVAAYTSFEEMLQDPHIDAVHICTPHHLHFPMIRAALECGKAVVAEKPMTRTLEEWNALLALAGADRVCSVVQNRYNYCIQKLKALIDSGALGEIVGIKGILTWKREPSYYSSTPWKGRWETEGGSVLINQALHALDLMVYLGGQVEAVQASTHNHTLQGVIETEDTAEAVLQLSGDVRGLLYASNGYAADSPMDIEVVGSKATARYVYKKLFVNCELVADDDSPLTEKEYWGCGHEALLRDYYAHGRCFTPGDIDNSMRTLFAIYESAAGSGKEIRIPKQHEI